MKKILFVNPPVLNTELYGKLGEAGSNACPLGLCSLAAVVRGQGFDTAILDSRSLNMSKGETVDEILRIGPDYLGLTAVTLTINKAAEIAKEIKKQDKNIIIILGGPHVTAVPEETLLRYPEFDMGVIGEGELTIVELLSALEKGTGLASIEGIIFKSNGTLQKTAKRKFIEDLDTLPMPAWDLLPNLSRYYRPTAYSVYKLPSTHLVTSRGCPGKCIFCDTAVFGSKYRCFSSGYVMNIIRYLYNTYGIRDFLFDDDLFIGNRKRLFEICNALIDAKLNLSWSCNARIDLIDRDMLKLMKRSGCWQIAYGIESGSQRILDYIKKNTTLQKIKEVLRWTTQEKIRTKGFFMMAYPIETKEEILQTIDFTKKIDLYDFQINFLAPLPGSEAYKMALESGVQLGSWDTLNFHTDPTFIPRGLTREELIRLNKLAFRQFYLRPKIIFSYLFMVNSWGNFVKLIKGALALLKFWS